MPYKNKENEKIWRENNKERKSAVDKKYREEHKEEMAEYKRLWNIKHREEQLKKKKIYRETHQNEIKESRKRYKEKHNDRIVQGNKKYYEKNREKINDKRTNYRQLHKEKMQQQQREAYRENPERWKNGVSKRRAIKKVTDITTEWLRRLYQETDNCPICNIELDKIKCNNYPNGSHLDHIIPLNVGGLHMMNNVRIICFKCNMKRPRDGRDVI